MYKNYINKFLALLLVCQMFVVALPVSAQLLTGDGQDNVTDAMRSSGSEGGYTTTGGTNGNFLLSGAASTIVGAFLALLGIIFLVMIILGGFNWMTAAGSDDKVTKARATLVRGIIGLVIVVTAYVITAFVFRALAGVIGAP